MQSKTTAAQKCKRAAIAIPPIKKTTKKRLVFTPLILADWVDSRTPLRRKMGTQVFFRSIQFSRVFSWPRCLGRSRRWLLLRRPSGWVRGVETGRGATLRRAGIAPAEHRRLFRRVRKILTNYTKSDIFEHFSTMYGRPRCASFRGCSRGRCQWFRAVP